MPHDNPDPTDPLTLHGVAVATDDPLAMREMAIALIDEYLRMGDTPDRLLHMFKTPKYAGPHMAFNSLGEATIVQLIDEAAQMWGGRRASNPLAVVDPRR